MRALHKKLLKFLCSLALLPYGESTEDEGEEINASVFFLYYSGRSVIFLTQNEI
jgi:hypothetical protein